MPCCGGGCGGGPRPPQCSPQHQRSAALIRARPSLPVAPPVPAAPADAPFPAPAAKHASRPATPRHIHRLRHTPCTSASAMPATPSPFIFQGRAAPKAASAYPLALRFPQPLPSVRPATDPPAVPQPHSRFACNPALPPCQPSPLPNLPPNPPPNPLFCSSKAHMVHSAPIAFSFTIQINVFSKR